MNLNILERVAKEAAEAYPGDWVMVQGSDGEYSGVKATGKMPYDEHVVVPYAEYESPGTCVPEYIARMNPDTALKLIKVAQAAEFIRDWGGPYSSEYQHEQHQKLLRALGELFSEHP